LVGSSEVRETCLLSFSPLDRDPRVFRQALALRNHYGVMAVGYGRLGLGGVRTYSINKRKSKNMDLKLISAMLLGFGRLIPSLNELYGRMNSDYMEMLEFCLGNRFDVYHANDPEALPIAVKAARRWKAKVVYDAHEYSPDNVVSRIAPERLFTSYYTWILQNYRPDVHAMSTVSPGIAALYRERFSLNPTIILNAASYEKLPFNPVRRDQIRLVHHGKASTRRNLEKMIDLMTLLDKRFSLTFYLVSDSHDKYLWRLEKMARRKAPNRVFFKDAVDMRYISRELNQYDIGIFLLPWRNMNQKFVLPNKFFEFIMAGLAIFIGPSPEMAQYVKAHECGWINDSFDLRDCAVKLNALTAGEVEKRKTKSLEAAKCLNAEVEGKKLLSIYATLCGEEKEKRILPLIGATG